MAHEPTDLLPLTEAEVADLAHCEAVIAAGLQTFYETGAALATVRDVRLYRATHATFEAYCRDRWGLGRRRAYQLIDAAGVVANVQNFTQTPPRTESHAAPLVSLSAEQQGEVWQEAVVTATNGKMTAAHVAETRDRLICPEPTIALVPDAIIDPPAPLPAAIMDIIRSPTQRALTLRQDFSAVLQSLFAAARRAELLMREVPPAEMAALLEDNDLKDERHVMPTVDWVRAVFAARRDTPAIRRIK